MKYGKGFLNTKGLQIGNYVATNLATSGSIEISNILEIYEYIIVCENKQKTIKNLSVFEIRPIVLTEDFLYKLGFYKNGDSFYHKEHNNDFIIDISEYISLSGVPEFEIKYVHQLQNIYKSLTGLDLFFNSGVYGHTTMYVRAFSEE